MTLRAAVVLFLATVSPAAAHKSSDSYLTLAVSQGEVAGRWEIALRDLDDAIGLDDDSDGKLTWAEVQAHGPEIDAYAIGHLTVANDGAPCPLTVGALQIAQHGDGGYAVLPLRAGCAQAVRQLTLGYNLLFDLDPQHRGLLNLSREGGTATFAFSPTSRIFQSTAGATSRSRTFSSYLRTGVWHIWSGYDHILFLLALLLPAVLRRTPQGWEKAPSFKAALISVLKTVTAFTLAHSITLSCAALGLIALPSRLVESTIAASVIVAALNNVVPLFGDRTWPVAFGFGLVHGLGFANVLFELGLPKDAMAVALVGFNLGVEIGQLAIVAAFLPIAYRLRASQAYARVVLSGGSACIVAIALAWFIERAFNIQIVWRVIA